MKLETWHLPEVKRRFKVVRTDNFADVPGEIVYADEATGECTITAQKAGCPPGETETKHLSLGPRGLRIASRGR